MTTGIVASSSQVVPGPSPRRGLYDANPNHLWNRIHEVFHVRVAPDGFRIRGSMSSRRPPFGPPSSLRRRGPNIPSTTQTRRRPAGSTNEARTFRQEESGLRQMPARAWPLQRVDRPVAIAASTPDHRQGRRTRPSTDYSRRRQATPGGRGAPCAGVAEQRVGTKPRGTPRIGCQRLTRRLPQPECPTPASPRRRTSQSRRLQVRGKPDCSTR
jgi:hypothetical protein